MHTLRRYLPPLSLSLLCALLIACTQPATELQRVLQEKQLVVLTRDAATTYYEDSQGYNGLEYDLAKGFAESLGVELRMEVENNLNRLLTRLTEGEADFAAAGLTITQPRQSWLRFTPPYQHITQQLVYHSTTPRPKSLDQLDGILEVIAGSSHEERLNTLHSKHLNLSWSENHEADSNELMDMVWQRLIDYTVADSNEVSLFRRYYPNLRVAFDISPPEPLAWAFSRSRDGSLHRAASDYFEHIRKNGVLKKLLERHYGHLQEFDYVETRTFLRHIKMRLPQYRHLFEYFAKEFDLDWVTLAATAYQESHWDPDAVSPTGVRGIMMLTKDTAGFIGVTDRTDAVESIRGGALYLSQLRDKLNPRITEPDRTWLALAAYNIGYGHLNDARILTEKRGANPDLWMAVKEDLPRLHYQRWFKQTKHGYARGRQAVDYVESIRNYYNILGWKLAQQEPEPAPSAPQIELNGPAL